jgi:hypothetical protein
MAELKVRLKRSFTTELADMAEMAEKRYKTDKAEKVLEVKYQADKAKKELEMNYSTPKKTSHLRGFEIHEAYLKENAEHYQDPKNLSSPVASDSFPSSTGTEISELESLAASSASSSAELPFPTQPMWEDEGSQPYFV